jgi:NADH:ubiquinone oxidoreductase subunit 6 (subunit J)
MDLALLVYAINTLPGISIVLGILASLSAVIILCLFMYMVDQTDRNQDKENIAWAWKRIKIWSGIGLAMVFLVVLLPSQKTAYVMVGAYVAQKIAQDPKVEQMGSKVLVIINQKLDQYVDEGIDKAKEVVKDKVSK